MLGGDEDSSTPLTSERDSLQEAKNHEDCSTEPAGLIVGGEDTDEAGGHTHHGDRHDKRLSSTDPIADVTEDDGTYRPDDEGQSNRQEGGQGPSKPTERVKEQWADKERREVGVNVEVVRLEGCPHKGRPSGFSRHYRIGLNHASPPGKSLQCNYWTKYKKQILLQL